MNTSNKGLRISLLFGFATILSGCGESSDELDDKLTHEARVTFVNSLDYMADIHLKKRNISTGYSGLFDNDTIISSDVASNAVATTYRYSYKAINNMINLGVKNSITANQEERITKTLSNNDNLWVIAWEAAGEQTISVVNKKQNNNADVFNVRLFANGNYTVLIDNTKTITTEKGKVTDYLSVSSCANGLKVADKFIDLCTGNFGTSYLLVVDSNGKRVMAKE
ncbi:hypothetical protein [Pseudoalteromonas sp. S558]|uniref:hypothetical protein n=1 Tax=Pseudoalteromonas sp. S558 TaxID=2066515 RepID=UPI00110BA9F4|nr:hypothetical protein [Pseudoalteromonas sp. S558]TMO03119.1 hypothetical protein CWB66_11680 [Pseudoalteromonas sp. S558]